MESVNKNSNKKKNKPDLIIWNNGVKTCEVVEFSSPTDTNVSMKVSEKKNTYGPLTPWLYREGIQQNNQCIATKVNYWKS